MRRRGWNVDRLTLGTGLVGVTFVVAAFVLNVVIIGIDAPGTDATAAELGEFVEEHETALEVDVGQRFVVYLLFIPFVIGVARYVSGTREDEAVRLLTLAAVLGAAWVLAAGTVANALFAIAVFEGERLATEPELARTLLLGQHALFVVAAWPHALIIGALSTAGLRARSLPVWLAVVGYLQVCAAVVAVAFLPRSLEGGSAAEAAAGLATAGFGLWYVLVSALLIAAWLRREEGMAVEEGGEQREGVTA
jgi:hypothetical protein